MTSNRTYKRGLVMGIAFGCDVFPDGQNIVLESVDYDTVVRTDISEKANRHGSYSSITLADGRIFNFKGKIYADTSADLETLIRKINYCIQPEYQPFNYTRGFYDLTWTDGLGVNRLVKAKVYTTPKYTYDIKKNQATFEFELLAENEAIFTDNLETVNGFIGISGGFTLPTPLPAYLSGYAGYLTCSNDGNRQTPLRIEVKGNVVNPRLLNITNGMSYRLGKTTTNLVYDNINMENSPTKNMVVTDNGVDASQYRISGGGIFLTPGANHLIVLADQPSTATVKIQFRDGRIY